VTAKLRSPSYARPSTRSPVRPTADLAKGLRDRVEQTGRLILAAHATFLLGHGSRCLDVEIAPLR